MGKGENAGYQQFLLFLQYFQMLFFSGSFKVGIVWERVKLHHTILSSSDHREKNTFENSVGKEEKKYKLVFFLVSPLISNLRQSIASLTLYYTIPTFNDPEEKALEINWKKEKILVTSIFSFSHNVSYSS